MTRPEHPEARERRELEWRISGLMFVAVCVASASLTSVLDALAWWFVVVINAAIIFGAPTLARWLTPRRWVPPVAALAAAVATPTLFFAIDTAVLGIVPTLETLERFGELIQVGELSIINQGIPAVAIDGIVFLLCLGVTAICLAMEAFAFWLGAPAFAGLPLLVLLLVPSFVNSDLNDPFFFALTAALYLALLLVTARRPFTRTAGALATMAIVGSLLLPIALPSVNADPGGVGPSNAVTTGVNPIIDLGNDLRRASPALAATYTTDAGTGVYLKLSTLDDFSGREWGPSTVDTIPGNRISDIGPAPGVTEEIAVTDVVTNVSVGNIRGRWLPVPYAATSITGLRGNWTWEPDGLSIRSDNSNMRDQDYRVESQLIRPNSDQLIAAGSTVESELERYLALPEDLPPIVAETALEVVGGAVTHFEMAVALQDYFTKGVFDYSEEAPVRSGYDGSGAQVLGEFLEAKSGYCVHFASAMAAMARTLGIPARVAVGFAPGEPILDDNDVVSEYRVSTDDLHAWPELYFVGAGWVQFEPTPGRGFSPDFTPPPVDDPATPDVDESIPTTAPTATPTDGPTNLPDEEVLPTDAGASGGGGSQVPWFTAGAIAVLAGLLVPWAVRTARRFSRLSALARGGSVVLAWDELRDTARDLGWAVSETDTPRVVAADLVDQLGEIAPDVRDAIDRLREAVEFESFSQRTVKLDPADVRVVADELRRASGPRDRLLASVVPRSLFARWLPAVSRAD